MSRGLIQTANNHTKADHHSGIGDGFSMVPQQPRSFVDLLSGGVVSGPPNAPAPPSAAGPGKEPPHSLLGSLTGIEIDISPYWPTGDSTRLAIAGYAWQAAHDSLIGVQGRLSALVKTITDHSDAPDIDAFGLYWKKLYRAGDAATVVEGLPRLCGSIAKACHEYSGAIRQSELRINSAAANPIAVLVEVAALRAALALAARQLLQTVTVIAGGALAGHLIASVTAGAANAPDLRILEAELDDSVLREWQNLGDAAPDTGDLESDVGKIARELGYTEKEIDEAIHGVKGAGDWRGIGGNKNPDIVVDLNTGEVYPQARKGVGDSIGNIRDHLPED